MSLKKKLVKQGVLKEKCHREDCSIQKEWRGKPLTLQLHHVDGDRTNDNPENLELLCPNCHSQTDNYGGKKKSQKRRVILEIIFL